MNRFFNYLLKSTNAVAALLLAAVGTIVLLYGGYSSIKALKNIILRYNSEEQLISDVLKGVDVIFLGIVIQLLGVGLYELFVGKLEQLPDWMVVENFDELKALLVKSSITVVTISFVGKVVTWDGGENILHYGLGIGAVVAALTYFIYVKKE